MRELLLSLSAEVSVAATAATAGLIGTVGGPHGAVGRGQGADELLQVLGRRRGPAAGRIWVPLRAESDGSGC